MKNSIVLLGLLLFFVSCQNHLSMEDKEKTATTDMRQIQQLKWLIGNWENISKEGNLYEVWSQKNDSVIIGKSYLIVKNDTVFSEKISLELKAGILFYIPVVSNQNNKQPVLFKLISDSNREFIFENKEHDFPQRIIYKNPKPDSLFARIEGIEKGNFHEEKFYFIRKEK